MSQTAHACGSGVPVARGLDASGSEQTANTGAAHLARSSWTHNNLCELHGVVCHTRLCAAACASHETDCASTLLTLHTRRP